MNRSGEKIGWTGGWLGSFSWVLIFAIIWFFQKSLIYGIAGIILFSLAVLSIVYFSPWKHPNTKYWKLMSPIYFIFLLSIIFVLYVFNALFEPAKIQYGLWIFPCFTPMLILGNKTWN